jgi:formate-dependent nitrite reductase membrane component NrfD
MSQRVAVELLLLALAGISLLAAGYQFRTYTSSRSARRFLWLAALYVGLAGVLRLL